MSATPSYDGDVDWSLADVEGEDAQLVEGALVECTHEDGVGLAYIGGVGREGEYVHVGTVYIHLSCTPTCPVEDIHLDTQLCTPYAGEISPHLHHLHPSTSGVG